jgi:hypothetical protein
MGDIAAASRLSHHFPLAAGLLFAMGATLLIIAPLVLIVHGAHWPGSAVTILAASAPAWVLALLLVRWNKPPDDGERGS